MNQQKVTFHAMFDHVKDDGVYLCEDLATSYERTQEPGTSGGPPGTMISLTKEWIDWLNAYFVDGRMDQGEPSHRFDSLATYGSFSRHVESIHFYSQIAVRSGGRYIDNGQWDGKLYPMEMNDWQSKYAGV